PGRPPFSYWDRKLVWIWPPSAVSRLCTRSASSRGALRDGVHYQAAAVGSRHSDAMRLLLRRADQLAPPERLQDLEDGQHDRSSEQRDKPRLPTQRTEADELSDRRPGEQEDNDSCHHRNDDAEREVSAAEGVEQRGAEGPVHQDESQDGADQGCENEP